MATQEKISVKKEDNFSEWYTQVLNKAELADIRTGMKGLIVYRPWSTRSIKKMYRILEKILEQKGHEPITFPLLIPESNLTKESDHVAGFTPEVFWVTEHGDGEKFEERLALRPTGETIIYPMYSLWVRSHKDLPLKGYQSCSVFRCEGKSTRPFFRGREFHWVEAHCVHKDHDSAIKQVHEDMETTYEFLLDQLALPFIFFQRPQWDKFPGAVNTYAADALMYNGKVIQLPSTHDLGTGFSEVFNIRFTDSDEKEKLGHLTCYGPAISRIYGAMIAFHGDDKGLVLPFNAAPYNLVIIPILIKGKEEIVMNKCKELKELLSSTFDVLLDDSENSPGYKFNEWELKGVPLRLEVGPRDIENKQVVVARRDLGEKTTIQETELLEKLFELRDAYIANLKDHATHLFDDRVVNCKSIEEVKVALDGNKIARVEFCSIDKDGECCAAKIEKEIGGFVRGTKLDEKEDPKDYCVVCGKEATVFAYVARSY
jgi:prolyl-tRNA synthetase